MGMARPLTRWSLRFSTLRRLGRLASSPREAWQEIAEESVHPASVLLPGPAIMAAVGPVGFLLAHLIGGPDLPSLSAGRALGFAVVYYALLMGLLVGEAEVLRRVGGALGGVVEAQDAFKLAVWSSPPFLLSGVAFVLPVGNWDSVVVVSGLLGLLFGGYWLYRGLDVLSRGVERRPAGLAAAAAAGSLATAWILGLFLLSAIVL